MFLQKYSKDLLKEEKKVLTVPESYDYWVNQLFEKCVRIFEWDGLPDSIPQKEIELRLISYGFCGFVDDGFKGLMVASGSLSGPTQYFDEFKNFTYAAATAKGGTKTIGVSSAIINNTSLRTGLMPMISRYASMLAHTEVSLKCALINSRLTGLFSSEDDATAENIKKVLDNFYIGQHDVIVDQSLIDSIKSYNQGTGSGMSALDCINARNEILRSFFAEIGIKMAKDKKERLITDEVTQNDSMLLLNINDMLRQREKACEMINKIFNLNVSVRLNKEFEILEMEETDNGKNDSEAVSATDTQ